MKNLTYRLTFLFLIVGLSACASDSSSGGKGSQRGTGQGIYKVGKPYEINGTTYTPHEDFSYDETGIASWYGQEFHAGATANGEIFNKNELTAAHKTLPLPTLARVTNLDNGRSIVVRINDRGPFSGARIIDVSQRAAQLLGFEQSGTAKVRVQVLADESKAIADAMQHYGSAAPTTLAANNTLAAAAPEVGGYASQPAGSETISTSQPYQQQVAAGAPIVPVMSQALSEPSPESAHIQPTTTTPQIHQQLLATHPVQQVTQLPVMASGQIYVQVGAFTVPENATKLQQTIAGLGPTNVANAVVNGVKFYRVRLGPVATVAQADALVAKARQAGYTNARTVVD
jgi:rare lipoprotein A